MHCKKYMKNFEIFNKITKHIRNNNKSDDYINTFYMDYISECVALQSYHYIKNKRDILYDVLSNRSSFYILKSIVSNKFLTDKQHEYFIEYWGKLQHLYFVLSRFVTRSKYFYCNKSITETDMCLEPLDDLPSSIVISVIDNNTLYKFRISDLINLINTKLTHSPNFFSDPLPITNPYTNGYFNDSQLYNIYFKIRRSTYLMPTLFHSFFLAGFDLDVFLYDNESTLRDHSINRYHKSLSCEQKFKHIKNIIIKNRSMIPSVNTCLRIAPHMCKDNILKHMSPMLNDYLHSTFSLLPSKRFACQEKLRKSLRRMNRSIMKNEIDVITRTKPFTNKINGIPTQWGVLHGMNPGNTTFDSHPFVFGQETIEFNQPWHNANNVRRSLVNAFNDALETAQYNPSDTQIYNNEEEDVYSHASEGDQVLPTDTDEESNGSIPDLISPEHDYESDIGDSSQDISGNLIVSGIGFNLGNIQSSL